MLDFCQTAYTGALGAFKEISFPLQGNCPTHVLFFLFDFFLERCY